MTMSFTLATWSLHTIPITKHRTLTLHPWNQHKASEAFIQTYDIYFDPDQEIWNSSEGDWGLRLGDFCAVKYEYWTDGFLYFTPLQEKKVSLHINRIYPRSYLLKNIFHITQKQTYKFLPALVAQYVFTCPMWINTVQFWDGSTYHQWCQICR